MADLSGHEGDRKKYDDQRQCRRHYRQSDFAGCLGCGFAGRDLLFLHVAEDVFQYHNRIVDNDPGCKRKRKHRHVVQCEAERFHERESADDRCRDRDRRNDRASEIAHEEKHDDAGEQSAEEEVMLNLRQKSGG